MANDKYLNFSEMSTLSEVVESDHRNRRVLAKAIGIPYQKFANLMNVPDRSPGISFDQARTIYEALGKPSELKFLLSKKRFEQPEVTEEPNDPESQLPALDFMLSNYTLTKKEPSTSDDSPIDNHLTVLRDGYYSSAPEKQKRIEDQLKRVLLDILCS